MLFRSQTGTQLILVTHHVEEIMPCIQRTVLLKSGRIFFDGFSSNIAATYTKKIKEMAAFVLVSGFSEVQITGHSDQFKNAPLVKNSSLSTKRATQVADAMKKLLPKVKFSAVGRGNSSPYKSGKFADPKNRRVQIYTR